MKFHPYGKNFKKIKIINFQTKIISIMKKEFASLKHEIKLKESILKNVTIELKMYTIYYFLMNST